MSTQVDEFRAVFDAAYPKVVAYARRRVDDTVADDVVAETFLVAWRRRDEVSAMDNPLPWLYAVAGNQLRNQNRSTNRHLRLVSKVAGDAAADSARSETMGADGFPTDTEHAVDLIRDALATLSFDDQEVLRLVAWEELTYQQTADVLGCSVDAVAQRIRRAKQRLAGVIANVSGDDAASTPTDPTHTASSSSDSRTHTRGA